MRPKSYPYKRIAKQPLALRAYDKIYQHIITLEYKPGRNLEERELMNQLGFGRTPIREALLRLAGENLIDSKPGKGFIVRPITLQNTKAAFEAMKILESGAARLALRQDITPYLPEMERTHQRVKSAIASMNILELVEANHEFHRLFAQCSFNEYLIRWINEIRNEAKRLSYLSYANEIDPENSLKTHYESVISEHEGIITKLKERDENSLINTIVAHIQAFQRRILLFMSS
ncbi:MAG: GntR family transcriptional regulator [Thermodesulfobacteriota bacterium]